VNHPRCAAYYYKEKQRNSNTTCFWIPLPTFMNYWRSSALLASVIQAWIQKNTRTSTPDALRKSITVTFTERDNALLMKSDESTADW